jgi:hypothetical protein
MNRSGSILSAALLLAISFLPLSAHNGQDREATKEKKKALKIQSDCRDFNMAPIEIDLSRLEFSLQELQFSLMELEAARLPELEFHLADLPATEIPEINIPPVDLPHLAVAIAPIPPIEIPEIAVGELAPDCDVAAHKVFRDLSDEDQMRLQALRSLACQSAEQAIAAYHQVQKKARPAFRYEAVRQLGHFLEDGRVLPLIADAAKTDKNIEVRKKAITLLGKSRDPRSTKILEEILLNEWR